MTDIKATRAELKRWQRNVNGKADPNDKLMDEMVNWMYRRLVDGGSVNDFVNDTKALRRDFKQEFGSRLMRRR
jgi:hypothetical protein